MVEPRDGHLCCGSAGTYNLLQPEISGELRARKVATLEEVAPQVIAAGNIGCMMQIGGGDGGAGGAYGGAARLGDGRAAAGGARLMRADAALAPGAARRRGRRRWRTSRSGGCSGRGRRRPIAAVGRLNIAGTRFCTATLIEPAVVVTAAHCLFHPRTQARVPMREIRFVAGLRRGEVAAVRRAVKAVTQPDFAFDGMASYAGVRADLALVELDEPVAGGGGGGCSRRGRWSRRGRRWRSSPTPATGRRRRRSRRPA